tara:strand:- start:850 stop:1236 length:387 start_codon:yes stop_codon:yes gene_type:complete
MGNIKIGRISCDFDDTIVIRGQGLDIKSIVPHCKEALYLLRKKGYEIIVSSCRTNTVFGGKDGKGHKDMVEFLKKQNIPYDHVDEGDQGKVVCSFYCDDRGVGAPLTKEGYFDWKKAYLLITKDNLKE